MKLKKTPKLSLNRETLLPLEQVQGGADIPKTSVCSVSCPIYCQSLQPTCPGRCIGNG